MNDRPDIHPQVAAALEAASDAWRVVSHASMDREIRSPQDFAAALGWDPQRITKSLLIRPQRGTEFVMVVCPALSKLDFTKVSTLLRVRHEVATRAELDSVISYPITGVTPLGIPDDVRVIVDAGLSDVGSIMTGSGVAGVEVEVSVRDLIELCSATVADVIQ